MTTSGRRLDGTDGSDGRMTTGFVHVPPIPDPNIVSETAPQVRNIPTWDSRLVRTWIPGLTPNRIRELRRNPTVSFMRNVVVAPMVHTPWTIMTKPNAPAGAKELIEATVFPHRLWLLQGGTHGALDFGWQPYELVWGMKDGFQIIEQFKQLLQDYTTILIYRDSGNFAGFTNEPITAPNTLLLEPQAMNIVFEVEGQEWYGRSKSEVINTTVAKWDGVDTSATRYDNKVAGATWILYYPTGKTTYNGQDTPNQDIARDILSKLEASGAVAIPDEVQEWMDDNIDKEMKGKWRVELISAQTNASTSFTDRAKYLDNLLARAFDLPERAVLEGKFGTKAEAETHADIGLSTIDVKHRLLVDILNKQAVNPLLRFNYGQEVEDLVWIQVAPLNDGRLSTIRDIFSRIIQNGDLAGNVSAMLDIEGMISELGIPMPEGHTGDS